MAQGWAIFFHGARASRPPSGRERSKITFCGASKSGPGMGHLFQTRCEPTDKPGSVVDSHSSGYTVTDDLKRPTRTHRGQRGIAFLFGLAPRWGLPCHSVLPATRCALTAPFHPYLAAFTLRRYLFCCTFRRLTPPRRYLAPCPVEPGLSSPAEAGAAVWSARHAIFLDSDDGEHPYGQFSRLYPMQNRARDGKLPSVLLPPGKPCSRATL